jgi:F0F1-type ATP synthase alpha subunit
VTRAGGLGHNKRQKELSGRALKILADSRQAEEFSHFGSELAVEAKAALAGGQRLFKILTQAPGETHSLLAQQLIFDLILNVQENEELNLTTLKQQADTYAAKITKDEEYAKVRELLKQVCLVDIKGDLTPKPAMGVRG